MRPARHPSAGERTAAAPAQSGEDLARLRIAVTTIGDLLLTAADRFPQTLALVFPDAAIHLRGPGGARDAPRTQSAGARNQAARQGRHPDAHLPGIRRGVLRRGPVRRGDRADQRALPVERDQLRDRERRHRDARDDRHDRRTGELRRAPGRRPAGPQVPNQSAQASPRAGAEAAQHRDDRRLDAAWLRVAARIRPRRRGRARAQRPRLEARRARARRRSHAVHLRHDGASEGLPDHARGAGAQLHRARPASIPSDPRRPLLVAAADVPHRLGPADARDLRRRRNLPHDGLLRSRRRAEDAREVQGHRDLSLLRHDHARLDLPSRFPEDQPQADQAHELELRGPAAGGRGVDHARDAAGAAGRQLRHDRDRGDRVHRLAGRGAIPADQPPRQAVAGARGAHRPARHRRGCGDRPARRGARARLQHARGLSQGPGEDRASDRRRRLVPHGRHRLARRARHDHVPRPLQGHAEGRRRERRRGRDRGPARAPPVGQARAGRRHSGRQVRRSSRRVRRTEAGQEGDRSGTRELLPTRSGAVSRCRASCASSTNGRCPRARSRNSGCATTWSPNCGSAEARA